MKVSSVGTDVLVTPIAVYSHVVIEKSFAGGSEGFDGEYIALLHTLAGLSFHKWNLLVPVDLVAQNVMASDVSNRFDWNDLSIELDFVALHYFLDLSADVVYTGIDASFLEDSLISMNVDRMGTTHLEPSIGGCLHSR